MKASAEEKKQAKNKATDINKALLPHNRMTRKSKIISPENRRRISRTSLSGQNILLRQ